MRSCMDVDNKVDRISYLPDEVICHILSFLKSKEAVATSILAKRWYPLWRSLSAIIIEPDNNNFPFPCIFDLGTTTYPRFSNFVSSLLRLRDVTVPIKKFRFNRISAVFNPQDISTWLSIVLGHNNALHLHHLHLAAVFHMPHFPLSLILWDLPISLILTCKNLVVLKLSSCNLDLTTITNEEEDELSLPCLRAIHLTTIHFKSVECLCKLLSGCPILEDFKGRHLSYHGSTKGIYLRSCYHGSSHLSSYDGSSNSSSIVVDSFKSLPRLKEAFIHFCGRIMVPLEAVYKVKELTLCIDWVFPHNYTSVPVFSNLTKLMLSHDEHDDRRPWLMIMLNHCPKLQILELEIKSQYHDDADGEWVCPKFVPECVSLHLRECTIHCHKNVEGGPQFARYIMQNASVLHAMRICTLRPQDLEFTIEKELPLCQKRSPSCQLSFVYAEHPHPDALHPASRSFF